MTNESGTGTVLVAALAALALVVCIAVVDVARVVAMQAQLATAADAAALAAAPVTFAPFGTSGDPAIAASRIAVLNGAQLVHCECSVDRSWRTREVTVTASATVRLALFGDRVLAATAAGRIPAYCTRSAVDWWTHPRGSQITTSPTIEREFTDGATAIVRGALAAGCDFFAGYPITPASPILMMMLRDLPARGGIGMQGEDEIASIGMCIGASMTGARAMTATAGPGISLYSENIGMAVMGEVPLVIVDVQRLGPSTGAATTTAQGDVQFVRWGTAGGFPIIALCPSTVAECYTLTMKAFDLAERFRCPVFLMADKELALTMRSVDPADYEQIEVRDRAIIDPDDVDPTPRIQLRTLR